MTTIFERVKTALATISPAVPYAMDSLKTTPSASLPDVYLAYSLIDSTPVLHTDDSEKGRDYLIQVSIFSRAGLVSLPLVDAAMLAAGFRRGDERTLPQDAQSGHYHLAKDFHYYEEI